jgi:hypothetical protein
MSAKVFGFEWISSQGVPINQLIQLIMTEQGEIRLGKSRRLLVLYETIDRLYGMIVTAHDRNKLTFLYKRENAWSTVIETLGPLKNQMDFNFFVVIKPTGRGLYLMQQNSCSLWSFCNFAKRIHDANAKGALQATLNEALQTGRVSRTSRRQLKELYCAFKWNYRCSSEAWEDLLLQARFIKSLRFKVQHPNLEQEYGVPTGPVIKWITKTISFNRELRPTGDMVNLINKIREIDSPMDLDANVLMGDNIIETIHLSSENRENCGTYDLDALSKLIEMEDLFRDFGNSPIIQKMNEIAEDHAGWLE